MKVTLMGIGLGTTDTLTMSAREALEKADAVLGAARLLDSLPEEIGGRRVDRFRPREVMEWLEEYPALERVCVVFSGDIGFHSGAQGLRLLLEEAGVEYESLCGVPTVSYLCARLGIAWDNVHLVSAHGVECNVLAHVLNHRRCFFLTGGKITPTRICEELTAAGLRDAEVTVAERLSYPDERILTGKAWQLLAHSYAPLSVVLVRRDIPAFAWNSRAGGIPDGAFLRGSAPMTKQEVRAVILARLHPAENEILWDIGAGTGSVAVEMALAARWGRVFAFERDPAACALIRENRGKFGAYNLTCVEGAAPSSFGGLPAPDAAFIGGSGGRLRRIMEELQRRNPRVRVVISAVTLETLSTAMRSMEELGFSGIEAAQVAVSRAGKVGQSHLLRALNPIFVLSGRGGAKKDG